MRALPITEANFQLGIAETYKPHTRKWDKGKTSRDEGLIKCSHPTGPSEVEGAQYEPYDVAIPRSVQPRHNLLFGSVIHAHAGANQETW